jgi:hypothetical protein
MRKYIDIHDFYEIPQLEAALYLGRTIQEEPPSKTLFNQNPLPPTGNTYIPIRLYLDQSNLKRTIGLVGVTPILNVGNITQYVRVFAFGVKDENLSILLTNKETSLRDEAILWLTEHAKTETTYKEVLINLANHLKIPHDLGK